MRKDLKNSFGRIYLTISHDKTKSCIRNQWQGILAVENVMLGATEVLNAMRETGCQYLLNDNRFVIGSWNQANEWIANVWTPQAMELGLKRFAHVVPAGMFGVASAEEMQRQVDDRFEMRLFKSVDEAKTWLNEARAAEGITETANQNTGTF